MATRGAPLFRADGKYSNIRKLPGLGANGTSTNGETSGLGRAFKGLVAGPGPGPSVRIIATNLRHITAPPGYYAALQQIQVCSPAALTLEPPSEKSAATRRLRNLTKHRRRNESRSRFVIKRHT